MDDLSLAIDTSTDRAFVAVVRTNATGAVTAVAEEASRGGNSHHEELATLTERAFAHLGVDARALSRVIVGAGPGSFTGLRIGYSFARGVSMSIGGPMFGVPSLAGAAWEFRSEGQPIVPVLDAGRGEVFCAVYRPTAAGLLTVAPAALVSREALSSHVRAFLGEIAPLFVALGERGGDGYQRPSRTALGLALVFRSEGRADVRSIDVEPEYLRAVAAKTIREREAIETRRGAV